MTQKVQLDLLDFGQGTPSTGLSTNHIAGTLPISKGGTGGTNGTDARKLINRSAYLGIGSATTLEAGKIYGVWTGGGSYTCTLPSYANAVVGDVIECVDYNLSTNTWAVSNWTLGCPANTYINNLAENMTIDVTGRITITCTYDDGTNKYWNVTLG